MIKKKDLKKIIDEFSTEKVEYITNATELFYREQLKGQMQEFKNDESKLPFDKVELYQKNKSN